MFGFLCKTEIQHYPNITHTWGVDYLFFRGKNSLSGVNGEVLMLSSGV